MANTVSAGIQETWSKMYQVTHFKVPVYPAFANFRLASDLEVGDTVNRVHTSEMRAKDLTSEGKFSRQDVTDTKEKLVIDTEKEASFYIKDLDELQNHLPVRAEYANKASAALFNKVDGDILGEYDQYKTTLDDGDLGGTDGDGISVTTSNIVKLFTKSKKNLQKENVALDNNARFKGFKRRMMTNRPVAVISPEIYETLLEYVEGKESVFGDKVSASGHQGRFMGYDLFVSNALGWSATLGLATNPADGDTITIGDATFTFKTSLGSSAGQIEIQGDVDSTRATLKNAINDPTTDISGEFNSWDEDSDEDKSLENVTASNDDTNDELTLKATGKGDMDVSESLTDGTDEWDAASQVQHALFGVSNSIDVVIQKEPTVDPRRRDQHVGWDVPTWCAYGYKVFNEHQPLMVDVQVRTDSY